jgi:putative hemolysin
MARSLRSTGWLILAIMTIAACGPRGTEPPVSTEVGLPNPASVFCEQQGGRLVIRQDTQGGEYGVCTFSDGSQCEEWAFLRGECHPGFGLTATETVVEPTSVATTAAPTVAKPTLIPTTAVPTDITPTPVPTTALPASTEPSPIVSDGWQIYTHPYFGYSFQYPGDATIEVNANQSVVITGPLVGDEHWPRFLILHPDTEYYHPSDEVDLQTWLVEHNMLRGEVQPSRDIAGMTAHHQRDAGSPQSYPSDHFFFVKAGQLYEVGIIHSGWKYDWALYDQFLSSFTFDR